MVMGCAPSASGMVTSVTPSVVSASRSVFTLTCKSGEATGLRQRISRLLRRLWADACGFREEEGIRVQLQLLPLLDARRRDRDVDHRLGAKHLQELRRRRAC